jgi:methylated-DNA-protein-cysteine methyltransferase-like protein
MVDYDENDKPPIADRVYSIVARIPFGRVTTYGSIAKAVGSIRGARMVGWLMHAVPPELDLPCHRVVNRYGYLSGGWHFGHPDIMRDRLLAEDVPFEDEYQVDLKRCLWLPWEADDPSTAADEVNDLDSVTGR